MSSFAHRRARASLARGLLAALPLALAALGPGCSDDAVGVDACRQVESARCEAAARCGEAAEVSVKDPAACKRFYRDHCLHGLSTAGEPSAARLKACVTTLEEAGRCAAEGGGDATLSSCTFSRPLGTPRARTACELIAAPEETEPCGFLTDEGPGSGGTAGSGAAGGSGGSGGGDAASE